MTVALAATCCALMLCMAPSRGDDAGQNAMSAIRAAGGTVTHGEGEGEGVSVDLTEATFDAHLAVRIAELHGVQKLILRSSNVSDADLRILCGIGTLHELDLWGTDITGDGLRDLRKNMCLTDVNLSATKVTDAAMQSIAKCVSLRSLGIVDTQVTDAGIAALDSLPNLTDVCVGRTSLTDAGLKHLSRHSKLKLVIALQTEVTAEAAEEFKKNRPDTHLIWSYQSRRKAAQPATTRGS